MDDVEMKELFQQMSSAMGTAIGGALESTFGDEAMARREESKERREKERAYIAARQEALNAVISSWRRKQSMHEQRASNAVASYCDSCTKEGYESLQRDPRMPGTINWEERFEAFRRMGDSDKLLMRIEQTIGTAEKIIKRNESVDPASAIEEASTKLQDAYSKLGNISVAAYESDKATEGVLAAIDDAVLHRTSSSRDASANVENAIAEAFREAMPEDADKVIEQLDEDSLEKRFEREIEQALVKSNAAIRSSEAINAKDVAGAKIDCSVIVPFVDKPKMEKEHDGAELLLLVSEVRASFKTYRQVIANNGVFSAFPDGKSNFGDCKGFVWNYWWDDDSFSQYTGHRDSDVADIESTVEEDGEGDTLDQTIGRMREFNKEKYWGMLDDDYAKHVNYFWYGFGKLMEFTNSMYKMDLDEFKAHFVKIGIALCNQAHDLGGQMNEKQLDDFCKQIEKLIAGVE